MGLKIVAVAGSYGKTSTKHILYHSLKTEIVSLATPKSVNTPLGIAWIILGDLQLKHKLFIVEFGEFSQGDVKKFCQFIKPDYGILTPIGRQHLERFGSLEKIILNFSGFIQHFHSKKSQLLVAYKNQKLFPKQKLTTYGLSTASDFTATQIKVSRRGTEFQVARQDNDPSITVFMPLYGGHQAGNTLPSFWLAQKLGISAQKVSKHLVKLPFIPHRHQPHFADNDVLILDNGYNSNPDSVRASLQLLNQLNPTHRIIITMGFVELGDDSPQIHYQFGKQLASDVDYLGLVQAPDTQKIVEGFLKHGGKKNQVVISSTQEGALQKLQDKIIPGSVILFENGFNEIYL